MKKTITPLATLFLLTMIGAPTAPRAEAADYTLDDQHTSVVFATSHFGFSYCYGMFGKYDGSFSIDLNDAASGRFNFRIDASSLDTKSAKRDEHLRGPDFFNVKQFPDIVFQSTGVTKEGDTLNVAGNLTLHGVTQPVVLPLTFVGEGKGPYGKERLGFFSRMTIKRSDYGIKAFLPNIGDEVTLMISFEGIKQ